LSDFVHDAARQARIGLPEAIFCAAKTPEQIARIARAVVARDGKALLTRLEPEKVAALPPELGLDHDPASRTGFAGEVTPLARAARVAIVTAGTSDHGTAREAARTLAFHGEAAALIEDVGAAGVWRLLERCQHIAAHPVVIAVAGMEGALFTVLGGLVGSALIAVPTSTGYGVAQGGHAALTSALASCAPGIVVVNIDNGYGAACAALRVLRSWGRASG